LTTKASPWPSATGDQIWSFFKACHDGNFEEAKLLLARGANSNLIDDHFRETPQQWAHRFKQKD